MLASAPSNTWLGYRQPGRAPANGSTDNAEPTRPTLHVLAAHADPAGVAFLQAALPRLGHRVQVARTGPELVEACRLLNPDVVVTALDLPGLDGLAAAGAVCRERPVPVVLVAPGYEPAAAARAEAAGWVMGCLPWPVGEDTLGAALALAARHFAHERALGAQVEELKHALEDRKVVERAKGAVSRRTGLDEDEAYRRLRGLASNSNRKLVDVAKDVLAAEAAFGQLESAASGAHGCPAPSHVPPRTNKART